MEHNNCRMRGTEPDWEAADPTVSLRMSEVGENDRFAKPLYGQKLYRGYESPPLRQIF